MPQAGRGTRGGSSTLDEATKDTPAKTPADTPGTAGGGAGAGAASAPATSPPPLPSLPTEKTRSGGELSEKTVLLYGPAGIGKSTLASEWAGGGAFFFDCAGELNDLEVYKSGTNGQPPITSWTIHRSYCAAILQAPGQFPVGVIDTADMLGTFCSQAVRRKLGIAHESDAEWGKGWTAVREEFQSNLAKLAAIPNFGVVLVSHSKEIDMKTRSAEWKKTVPTLTGGVRDACVNMADLVLYLDWAEDQAEGRVIRTKPSRYWDAKERGQAPRLPEEIPWPLGESGWDVLKKAWDEGGE